MSSPGPQRALALSALAALALAAPAATGQDAREPSPSAPTAADDHSALGAALEAWTTALERGAGTQRARALKPLLARPAETTDAVLALLAGAPAGRAAPRTYARRERALLELLEQLPREVVLERVEAALAQPASPAWTRAGLVALGAVARADDLPSALAAAVPAPGEELDPALVEALTGCLAGTLARDERAILWLDREWERLPDTLHASAVRALGASGRAESLEVLARLLQDAPQLEILVLGRLGALAERVPVAADRSVRAAVRGLLDAPRSDTRREAALALGRLEDTDAFAQLVVMLEHAERGEREAAYWALRRITGLGLQPDPDTWRAWHARELTWWQERQSSLQDDLARNDPAAVVAALDELSRHRLGRAELALAISMAPLGDRPELAERQCVALGALGSKAGVPLLVERLEHYDEAVRAAARPALARCSGLDLPPDPELWRRLLP